jgi:hypothetical protein
MAAFTSHIVPRAGLLTRLRAATGRHALDRRLARGADPDSSPELACAGPMFTEHPAGTLRETAFRAAFHLEAG